MGRSKPPLNQLKIPVAGFGRFPDPEETYAEKFGEEALARQKELYEEANRCSCGSEETRRGERYHKPGCPRHGPKKYAA